MGGVDTLCLVLYTKDIPTKGKNMLISKYLRRSDAVAAIERHNAKGGVQYRLGLVHHNGKRWYCVNVNLSH